MTRREVAPGSPQVVTMHARHQRRQRPTVHSYYFPQSRTVFAADLPLLDHRVHQRSAQPRPRRDWRRVVLGSAIAVMVVVGVILALVIPAMGDTHSAADREADFRSDTVFIPSYYGSPSDVLQLGYGVCEGLRKGISTETMGQIIVSSGLDRKNANLIVDSAQANLCPEEVR